MQKYFLILFIIPILSVGQNKITVSFYNKTEHVSKIYTEDTSFDLEPKRSVQITINRNKYLHRNKISYHKFIEGQTTWDNYDFYVFDDKKIDRKLVDSGNQVNIISTENEIVYSKLFYKNKIRKGIYNLDSLVYVNKNNLLGAEILYSEFCLRNEPLNKIDSLYSLLDNKMKKTNIGKSIENYLETKPEKLEEGNKIRNFGLPNAENKFIELNSIKSEYVLLDFWFAGCVPCIQRFVALKEIYPKLNRQKFEIIAITIDKKSAIPGWLELINRRDFNWINLIDSDEKLTFKKFRINQFPTSILLDKKRRIIKINPTEDEIKSYLN